MPLPSSMISPCSITCISTMLSAAPGWYTMVLTAKSNGASSGSRHLTCKSESPSSACEEIASSLETISRGGSISRLARKTFQQPQPGSFLCWGPNDSVRKSLRKIRVAARAQVVPLSFAFQGHRAFHHIDETLRARISQFALRLKFGSVFGERCAQRRTNVNDCRSILHPRQCRAHKSVRCLQNVIALMRAARLTEIMHGTSFPEILGTPQAGSAIDVRTPALSRHRQDAPIPPDRG